MICFPYLKFHIIIVHKRYDKYNCDHLNSTKWQKWCASLSQWCLPMSEMMVARINFPSFPLPYLSYLLASVCWYMHFRFDAVINTITIVYHHSIWYTMARILDASLHNFSVKWLSSSNGGRHITLPKCHRKRSHSMVYIDSIHTIARMFHLLNLDPA